MYVYIHTYSNFSHLGLEVKLIYLKDEFRMMRINPVIANEFMNESVTNVNLFLAH